MSLMLRKQMLMAVRRTIQPSRSFRLGGSNVYVTTPATVRIPFWEQITMCTVFVIAFLSYPFYITCRMHEWDKIDPNPVGGFDYPDAEFKAGKFPIVEKFLG